MKTSRRGEATPSSNPKLTSATETLRKKKKKKKNFSSLSSFNPDRRQRHAPLPPAASALAGLPRFFCRRRLQVPRPGPAVRLLRLRPGRSRPLPRARRVWPRQHLLPHRPRLCRSRLRLRRRLFGGGQLRGLERGQAGPGGAGDSKYALREGAAGPLVRDSLSDGDECECQQ